MGAIRPWHIAVLLCLLLISGALAAVAWMLIRRNREEAIDLDAGEATSGKDPDAPGRASLTYTGNRVFLAVLGGLLIGCLCNSGTTRLETGPHIALILLVAGGTYVALTMLSRRR